VLPGNQEYGRVAALQTYVLHIGCAYGPTVACGGSDPRVGMKGKRLLRNNLWIFQTVACGGLCTANRTGRSRVISYHSRDIGVECLLFCNHYKDDGRGHVQYHDSESYPVCVDQSC
jgi:hypothetical protein